MVWNIEYISKHWILSNRQDIPRVDVLVEYFFEFLYGDIRSRKHLSKHRCTYSKRFASFSLNWKSRSITEAIRLISSLFNSSKVIRICSSTRVTNVRLYILFHIVIMCMYNRIDKIGIGGRERERKRTLVLFHYQSYRGYLSKKWIWKYFFIRLANKYVLEFIRREMMIFIQSNLTFSLSCSSLLQQEEIHLMHSSARSMWKTTTTTKKIE